MADFYAQFSLVADRSIRILSLHAAANPLADLSCSLIIVDLDLRPEYKALSYAWESSGPNESILCDDKQLPITKNCASALRSLRHETERRLLWIDAICIDQSSMTERNTQVALMADIYQQATTVIVWLGASTPESREFFRDLHKFSTHFTKKIPLFLGEYLSKKKIKKMQKRWDSTDDHGAFRYPGTLVFTPSFQHILGRSWFKRMWTIQELALANSVTIVCGDDCMSWDLFYRSLVWLHSFTEFESVFNILQPYFQPWIMVMYFREVQQESIVEPHKKPPRRRFEEYPENALSETLIQCRAQNSTDAKDKVFALYGLFRTAGLEVTPPDYAKTPSEIFREVTLAVMQYDQSLKLLEQICLGVNTASWPSWVPDWADTEVREFPGRWNDATPQSIHSLESINEGRQIVLKGKIIDTVKNVGYPIIPVADQDVGNPDAVAGVQMANVYVLQDWFSIASSVLSYEVDESPHDAICATLCRGGDVTDDLRMGYTQWSNVVLAGNPESRLTTIDIDISYGYEDRENLPETAKQSRGGSFKEYKIWRLLYALEDCKRFQIMVMEHLTNHQMFSTENGRLGLAPRVVEGDLIVLFSGLKYPFVVRRDIQQGQGNVVRLVCPAYIHGVMKGQAWSTDQEELNEFIIA